MIQRLVEKIADGGAERAGENEGGPKQENEVCGILGDGGADQAALVASLMTSTPSINLIPSMSLGK